MKKQAITLVLTAIIFLPLQVMATIPNGSFENWGEIPSYEMPVNWYSATAASAVAQTGSSNVYKGENPEGEPHTQHYVTIETVNSTLAGTLFTGSTSPYIELNHAPDSVTYTIRHWDDDMSMFAGGVELAFSYTGHYTGFDWEAFHGDEDEFYEVTVDLNRLSNISVDKVEIWAESGETENCVLDIASITLWYNGEAVYEETFENWEGTNTPLLPDNWFTPDHMPINHEVETITRSTQSIHGDYALRMESAHLNSHNNELSYVRVSSDIDADKDFPDSLAFNYKYEPFNEGATATAIIEYYHHSEQSGNTFLERQLVQLPSSEEYTQFYVNFEQPEDEESNNLIIYFFASDMIEGGFASGNVMYLDNVRYVRGEDDDNDDPGNIISRFNDEISLSVYPNPASEFVNIEIPQMMTNKTEISIIDLSGSVIRNKASECTSRNCMVDMSDLNSGLYILRLTDGKHTFNQRIIIE